MRVSDHQFLNYDDNVYVTNNPHVASGFTGKNIIWAFTSTGEETSNWHPVTWLSHMADVEFFGMNPRGHHLTNVAVHALSSVLLLLLLFRLTGSLWQSSFVAFLFALHPLHVESVAWVAERKDVLSAFFGFLALLFYAEYTEKRKTMPYLLSLIFFVLGLMSKPMLVTFPIIMLLLDFWPIDRYLHDEGEQGLRYFTGSAITLIKEKIPFLACSLLSGIMTIYAQKEEIRSLHESSFQLRVENALIVYIRYIGKTFWPHDLAILYPMTWSFPLWEVIGSLIILLIVSLVAMRAGRQHPYLAVGWFWFLVALLPVIGLIRVGDQSMADRYTYIPSIGLFIMAAWGIPDLARTFKYRKSLLILLAGTVLIASAVLTRQQLGFWRDDISIYRHALQITADNYIIHNNLGTALDDKGDPDGALKEYREALRIKPDYINALNNLGLALAHRGDMDGAIKEYQKALRIKPDNINALNNLGLALANKGDLDGAIKEYQKALLIKPEYINALNNLGAVFANKGDLDGAIKQYQEALRIEPCYRDAYNNLGLVLVSKGDLDGAIEQYQKSLRINPNYSDTHTNLGCALLSKGDSDGAIKEFQEALRIEPNYLNAHVSLGLALAGKGNLDAAIRSFQQALSIDPNHAKTQNFLKLALAQKKMRDDVRK